MAFYAHMGANCAIPIVGFSHTMHADYFKISQQNKTAFSIPQNKPSKLCTGGWHMPVRATVYDAG